MIRRGKVKYDQHECECSVAHIKPKTPPDQTQTLQHHNESKGQSVQISDIELRITLRRYTKSPNSSPGYKICSAIHRCPVCLCSKRAHLSGKEGYTTTPNNQLHVIVHYIDININIYACAKMASVAQKLLRLSSSLTRPLPLVVIMLTEALDDRPNQLTLVELEISLMCSWQFCPGTHSCA